MAITNLTKLRPNVKSEVLALNDSGEAVGFYQTDLINDGPYHGFIEQGGSFTYFDDLKGIPANVSATPIAVNGLGEIAGMYYPAGGGLPSGVSLGFILSSNGTFSSFTVPGAGSGFSRGVVVTAINDAGQVAGYYYDSNGAAHGFIRASDGSIAQFSDPQAGNTYADGTFLTAINDSGEAVGFTRNNNQLFGFIAGSGDVAAPVAGLSLNDTRFEAINASGVITGSSFDGNGYHAFTYTSKSGYSILPNPAGGSSTFAHAINDSGQIAGDYVDGSGTELGFIYTNGKFRSFSDGSGTYVLSINAKGEVGGYAYPSTQSATTVGFVGLPSNGIDFQFASALSPSQIVAQGYDFVINYLGPANTSQYLTGAEAVAYSKAGLMIGSVYEVTVRNGVDLNPNIAANVPAYFASLNYTNGYNDATAAIKDASRIGQPTGSAIYFAVDANPAGSNNYLSDIVSYFQGIDKAFADLSGNALYDYSIGVYGFGATLTTIHDNNNLAQHTWLTGTSGYSNFSIDQVSIADTSTFPSVSIDHDILGLDPGLWQESVSQVADDFTGSGTSDALWYNAGTGDVDEWQIENGKWAGSVDLGSHPAGYQITGIADFNGDGTSDVFWYNQSTGRTDIWELLNGKWSASISPGTHPTEYQVAGVADFTGSGTSGVLFYNATSGDVDEWQINNGKWAASVDLGNHPGSGWQIGGVGDFNGDGTSDVFWYNQGTGQTDIWELANGKWSASVNPGNHPTGYQVAGIGDFNGDGTSDVLFYNSTTGDVDEWQIANGKWAGSVDLGSHPAGWQISGVGDYNGDGTSDVLWSNPNTGGSDIWLLANGKWAQSISPGSHPTGYQVAFPSS